MAQEQTAYAGDDIKVLVNVIDSTGSHVAATINATTTRIDGNSAAPTVTTVATGIYQITFSGVTPAPAEGDRLIVKVNGDIGGTAWSEYGIPVKILAQERGTDNVVVPTSDITAIKAKTDQLAFTVANQVDSNALTGGTSPADIYEYFTDGNREDEFKADIATYGIHQIQLTIQDGSANTVSNVRVTIDGTTIVAVTGADGIATFNVDPGTYEIRVAPPSEYVTPAAISVTVTSSNVAQTVTLDAASSSASAGWIG